MEPVHLGVNVDHVATLRQARGTRYPDPVAAALDRRAGGRRQHHRALARRPAAHSGARRRGAAAHGADTRQSRDGGNGLDGRLCDQAPAGGLLPGSGAPRGAHDRGRARRRRADAAHCGRVPGARAARHARLAVHRSGRRADRGERRRRALPSSSCTPGRMPRRRARARRTSSLASRRRPSALEPSGSSCMPVTGSTTTT